jgi:PAS domain S-box-containing protein
VTTLHGETTTEAAATLDTLLDVLGRTSDGLIAVDEDLRVVGWNDAAARLLGYSADEALGRPCHELLAWSDRCGDAVCGPDCPAACTGAADEIVETREVIGRSASGRTLWLNATTIVPPLELRQECRLIHLIREVALPPELERLVVERLSGWSLAGAGRDPRLASLTPREAEVLDLLAEGMDGPTIAEKLFVSPATVRNHVQHILRKLDVHSRLEAVSLLLRNGSH